MREPLAVPAEARSASRDKDAWGKNVFGEKGEDGELRAVLRPGQRIAFDVTDGVGQGVFNYGDDAYWLVDDVLYSSPMPTFPSAPYWFYGGPLGTGYSSGNRVWYQGSLYTSPTNNNLSTPPSGWTLITPTSRQLDPIIRLVAVARNSNAVAFSTDNGITWTSSTMPAVANWNALAWNGSVFCAVAPSRAAVSSNGLSWVSGTISAQDWVDIVWDGTNFCAVGYPSGGSAKVALSLDGITWTEYTTASAGTPQKLSVAWNGSTLLVNGALRATNTSATGTSWSAHTNALPAGSEYGPFTSKSGVFCGVRNGSAGTIGSTTSSDGISWASGDNTLPTSTDNFIATNGTIFVVVSNANANSYTSSDGLIWTQHTSVMPATGWNGITWNGTVFCAVRTGTIVATSSDGVVWTSRTIVNRNWFDVCAGL